MGEVQSLPQNKSERIHTHSFTCPSIKSVEKGDFQSIQYNAKVSKAA